jgi:hypothetical protein
MDIIIQHAEEIIDLLISVDGILPSPATLSYGQNWGKLYLPLDVSLDRLVKAELPYLDKVQVQENKTVIYFH